MVVVENMHDAPYVSPQHSGPEVVAAMTAVCVAVRRRWGRRPLGCQFALAVALASDLDFVRAEGFVFGHVADEGYTNACAGTLLRYRRHIGAQHIGIWADIKKKHSSHAITADVSLGDTARAAAFFGAAAVVVTGAATGEETDVGHLRGTLLATVLFMITGPIL
ncbi:uncharacterized protein F13E9.13, mitochondrial-like [Hyalella azteca]|uniref:Uncharacterized protein F13E9.13, mitochondrial-like n=1 Tax=Hyalella azteca TaxID=294128 RepID=A0A8B7MZC8_HYAAZ|nr:uncharacterized protein F13E9.13, mitochondrial-like [Hyalella azteca]